MIIAVEADDLLLELLKEVRKKRLVFTCKYLEELDKDFFKKFEFDKNKIVNEIKKFLKSLKDE